MRTLLILLVATAFAVSLIGAPPPTEAAPTILLSTAGERVIVAPATLDMALVVEKHPARTDGASSTIITATNPAIDFGTAITTANYSGGKPVGATASARYADMAMTGGLQYVGARGGNELVAYTAWPTGGGERYAFPETAFGRVDTETLRR
jgi:hypothetical protein